MMSEKQSNQSKKALEEQSTASVFDFLYHDGRRIASFLSQFDPNGYLTQVARREYAQRGKVDGGETTVKGGIATLAEGAGSTRHEVATSKSQERSKSYDPVWANALALLEYLDENDLITRGLDGSRIGSLALVQGQLAIRDLALIKEIMKLSSFKQSVSPQAAKGENRHERRKNKATGASDNREKSPSLEQEMGLDFISLLPHTVQAEIVEEHETAWCTLDPSCLITSSQDLLLKHGVEIPGEWAMLAIVDALPDQGQQGSGLDKPKLDFGTEMLAAQGFAGFIDEIVPIARVLVGRRGHYYGVTPLLIFRSVTD